MCGRYDNYIEREAYKALFQSERLPPSNFPPRYNIAPTDQIPIVRIDPRDGTRELAMARWGLIPFFMKEKPKVPHINARAETIDTQPMFREAFAKRRCLIPATGFYEWEKRADGRQPYRFRRQDLEPFAFAGLWEYARIKQEPGSEATGTKKKEARSGEAATGTKRNQARSGEAATGTGKKEAGDGDGKKGEGLLSATIIVGEPNSLVAGIHDRMPVILMPDDYDRWLDNATPSDELRAMLKPYDPAEWEAYPASRLVNSVKNDTEELVERVVDDSSKAGAAGQD